MGGGGSSFTGAFAVVGDGTGAGAGAAGAIGGGGAEGGAVRGAGAAGAGAPARLRENFTFIVEVAPGAIRWEAACTTGLPSAASASSAR